jgi:uncharacterized protein (TIGR02271 family)
MNSYDNDDMAGGLVPLDKLSDFKVADGYTDIRGFDAYTDDGREVGEVDQLLVDPAAQRVAAITIDVDRDLLDAGRDPRVQVPIEHVEINTSNQRITIEGAGVGYLGLAGASRHDAAAPSITGAAGTIARDQDNRAAGATRTSVDDEERIVLAGEELDLRKQRVDAGAVEIDKRVETEHVRESVPVMREEVTIERRPVTDATNTEARFDGNEIRIPIVEEEVVVEKRAVVKEELIIHKNQVQDERVVEAELRRERVETHETGRVDRVGDNDQRDRYAPTHDSGVDRDGTR